MKILRQTHYTPLLNLSPIPSISRYFKHNFPNFTLIENQSEKHEIGKKVIAKQTDKNWKYQQKSKHRNKLL